MLEAISFIWKCSVNLVSEVNCIIIYNIISVNNNGWQSDQQPADVEIANNNTFN